MRSSKGPDRRQHCAFSIAPFKNARANLVSQAQIYRATGVGHGCCTAIIQRRTQRWPWVQELRRLEDARRRLVAFENSFLPVTFVPLRPESRARERRMAPGTNDENARPYGFGQHQRPHPCPAGLRRMVWPPRAIETPVHHRDVGAVRLLRHAGDPDALSRQAFSFQRYHQHRNIRRVHRAGLSHPADRRPHCGSLSGVETFGEVRRDPDGAGLFHALLWR